MSVVVACVRDGVVYMGADSQTTSGPEKSRATGNEKYKITKLDNGLLIGLCGAVNVLQEIAAHSEWFDFGPDFRLTKKYLVRNVIPRMIALFGNNGMLDKEENYPRIAASALLAWKDTIYYITDYFRVITSKRYAAIGSGKYLTAPILAHVDPARDVNEQLLTALRVAANRETGISAPFVLIDTEGLNFKVVEE